MSRIGNRILAIKDDIKVSLEHGYWNEITIKGPKGTLKKQLSKEIKIVVEENTIKTLRSNDQKRNKQLHGTVNSVIQGMLEGVTKGFSKKLLINGIGYRASLKENEIHLSLGFSHPIVYKVPEEITVENKKPTELIISGIDKQLVGQVAAHIREFYKPEPYKGKGICYENEVIVRKVGKAAGK